MKHMPPIDLYQVWISAAFYSGKVIVQEFPLFFLSHFLSQCKNSSYLNNNNHFSIIPKPQKKTTAAEISIRNPFSPDATESCCHREHNAIHLRIHCFEVKVFLLAFTSHINNQASRWKQPNFCYFCMLFILCIHGLFHGKLFFAQFFFPFY